MYQDLQILETESAEKYLIRCNDQSMYVGYLVKSIIEFLQENKNHDEIIDLIIKKHNVRIGLGNIIEVENKLIQFLEKGQATASFYKLFKILDPCKINLPSRFYNIFSSKLFYLSLTLLTLLSVVIYFSSEDYGVNGVYEKTFFFLMLFIILFLHELGHAFAARKYHVDVRELGFGFYFIVPVLYVNLNEIWKLNNFKRIIINLSGIFVQFFLGLVLFFLSLIFKNQENIFISLFNLNLFIIIINLNPFLKFDGYWVLSDILNENNLMGKSNSMMLNLFLIKKIKSTKVIIIYTLLRFVFIIYILYKLIIYLVNGYKYLRYYKTFEWSIVLPMIIVLLFIIRIIYKITQNEYKRKKRSF
jgi:putative peptide zinc metalloprotease protein